MNLTAPQLVHVCQHARIPRDEIPTAVASALAASGGVPGYDYAIWPGPVARYMGLWALDVLEWSDYADRNLIDPYQAARAARELTDMHDGWTWCAAWRTGAYHRHLEHAASSMAVDPYRAPAGQPISAAYLPTATRSTLDEYVRLTDTLSRPHIRKGP